MRITVMEMGSVLRLKNGMLIVENEGKIVESCPLRKIDELVIESNVLASSPLLCKLAESGANVVFCTPNGWPRARVDPFVSGRIASVRKRQLSFFSNNQTCLAFSSLLVRAKMREQRRLVASVETDAPKEDINEKLATFCKRAENAKSIQELMGIEGGASRLYFGFIGNVIGDEWGFCGRSYNPPPDAVNAMLSYGYGILYAKIFSAIAKSGLDPYIGGLHADKYGRKSLVYDLAEPFKQAIVDRSVITIIRHKQVSPADFKSFSAIDEKVKRTIISQIEKRVEEMREWRGKRMSYLEHIHSQTARLKAYLNNETAEFMPFGL